MSDWKPGDHPRRTDGEVDFNALVDEPPVRTLVATLDQQVQMVFTLAMILVAVVSFWLTRRLVV